MSQQTGSNIIRLTQPGAGQTVTVPVDQDNMRMALGFEPDPNAVQKNGQDLEFNFEDGGKIVLQGYYDHFAGKTLPVMVTESGDELPGEDFLASLREDLLTAAGPGAGAGAPGGGAGEYADDPGALVDGISRLGSLGTIYWGYDSEVPEYYTGEAEVPGGSSSFTIGTDVGTTVYAGMFEDGQPFQNVGDARTFYAQLTFNFTPSSPTVVCDMVHMTGFHPGTRIYLGDPNDPNTEYIDVTGGQIISLTPAQFAAGVYLLPPADADADMNITTALAVRSEASGLERLIGGPTYTIVVDAVADMPTDIAAGDVTDGTVFAGGITVEDKDAAEYNQGWMQSTVSTADDTVNAEAATLSITKEVRATFGDTLDGSESHALFISVPAGAGWTCQVGTPPVALDIVYDVPGHEGQPFYRIPGEYVSLNAATGEAVVNVTFVNKGGDVLAGEGGNDVTIPLEVVAVATETNVTDQELTYDNNQAVNVGEGSLVLDLVNHELVVQAGWAYEGGSPDKNLNAGSNTAEYLDGSVGGTTHGTAAPINIFLSGASQNSGESITGLTITLPAGAEGVIQLNGVTQSSVINPDGSVTYTISGDFGTSVGGIVFVPAAGSTSDAEVPFDYTVTVRNGSGTVVDFSGSSHVTVDAVADLSTEVEAQTDTPVITGGLEYNTTGDHDRVNPETGREYADTGIETDVLSATYTEASLPVKLSVTTAFPDYDGSETHSILVERPDSGWTLGDTSGLPAWLTPAGTIVHPDPGGKTYFVFEVTDESGFFDQNGNLLPQYADANGNLKISVDVVLNSPAVSGDLAQVAIGTGSMAVEGASLGAGSEHDTGNNVAIRTDGTAVQVEADFINATLTVTTGWAYEGGNDFKFAAGGRPGQRPGSIEFNGPETAGTDFTGNAQTGYENSAPITIGLNGPADEVITRVVIRMPAGAEGDLYLDGAKLSYALDASDPDNPVWVYTIEPQSPATDLGNALNNLKFVPRADSYSDAEVPLDYTVSVKNAAGATADFKGTSTVVIDAVADASDAVKAEIEGGTTYHEIGSGSVSQDTNSARDVKGHGFETDEFSTDNGSSRTINLTITTRFPDMDGSETHSILVQAQPGWEMPDAATLAALGFKVGDPATITEKGVTYYNYEIIEFVDDGSGVMVPNPLFFNPDGSYKAEYTDGSGNFVVKIPLTTTETGDIDPVTFKTGTMAVENQDPAAGREYDEINNTATRIEGEVTYSADIISAGLKVQTGWAYEGNKGGASKNYQFTNEYEPVNGDVGSAGFNPGAATNANGAPVNIGLTGAGNGEYISEITITVSGGAPGSLVWTGGAGGTLTPLGNGLYTLTLTGTSTTDVSNKLFFKPDAGYSEEDVNLSYQVTVKNGSGAEVIFSGTSTVVIDAMADMGTFSDTANAVSYGTFADTGAPRTAAQRGEEVDVAIKVNFPDHDGSEAHTLIIAIPVGLTAAGAVSYADMAAQLAAAGLTQAQITNALGTNQNLTFLKVDADALMQAGGDVAYTLKVTIDSDAALKENGNETFTIKTVAWSQEQGASDNPGRDMEYNKGNDNAFRSQDYQVKVAEVGDTTAKADTAYEDHTPTQHVDPDAVAIATDGVITIKQADAGESITQLTLTFKGDLAELGTLSFGGKTIGVDQIAGVTYEVKNGVTTITFTNFNPATPLRYNPNTDDDRDVDFSWNMTVRDNASGHTATPHGELTVKVDAVADIARDVTQSDDITKGVVYGSGQGSAQGGDEVAFTVTATFSDFDDDSEQHFLLVEAREGWQCTNQGATTVSFTAAEIAAMGPAGAHLVAGQQYFKIPVANDAIPQNGTVDIEVTLVTPADNHGDETVNLDVLVVSQETRFNGTDSGADVDSKNNWAVVDREVSIDIGRVTTGGVAAQGGNVYENDQKWNNEAAAGADLVTGVNDTRELNGVALNVDMTDPGDSEYISQITVTILEPDASASDGWSADGTRGYLTYDGQKVSADENGVVTIRFIYGDGDATTYGYDTDGALVVTFGKNDAYDPSQLRFIPDGHEAGEVKLDVRVDVTDSSSLETVTFGGDDEPIEVMVNVDAVANRSGPVSADQVFDDEDLTAVAPGHEVKLGVNATFSDNDGSEHHYLLVQYEADWTSPAGYDKQMYDLDGDGTKEWYWKVPVPGAPAGPDAVEDEHTLSWSDYQTLLQTGTVTTRYGVTIELLDNGEWNVTAVVTLQPPTLAPGHYTLGTGSLAEEHYVNDATEDRNANNNVAMRPGAEASYSVSSIGGLGVNTNLIFETNTSFTDRDGKEILSDGKVNIYPTGADDALYGTTTVSIPGGGEHGFLVFEGTVLTEGTHYIAQNGVTFRVTVTDGGAKATFEPVQLKAGTTDQYEDCTSPADRYSGLQVEVKVSGTDYDDTDIKVSVDASIVNEATGQTNDNVQKGGTIIVDAVAQTPGDVMAETPVLVTDADGDAKFDAYQDAMKITFKANFVDVQADQHEVHYLLLEVLPGHVYTVDGNSTWNKVMGPDGKLYFQIPLDGPNAVNGVVWDNSGNASVDVTLNINDQFIHAGSTNINYGSMAAEEGYVDGEHYYDNNYAFNVGGSLDIDIDTGSGSSPVNVAVAYENNEPDQYNGEKQYAEVSLPQDADSVDLELTAPGASIWVNGVDMGQSATGVLPTDTVEIRLDDNYKDTDLGLKYTVNGGSHAGTGTAPIYVDAVAHVSGDVSGAAATDVNPGTGNPYEAIGDGPFKVRVTVDEFKDTQDGSSEHFVLIEARSGWECVDDNGKPLEMVSVEGRTYFKVPVTSFNPDGSATVEVNMRAPNAGSDGKLETTLAVGSMSVDNTGGDKELAFDNNVAYRVDGTIDIKKSVAQTTVKLAISDGWEANIAGYTPDGTELKGWSLLTLSGIAEANHDVLTHLQFTIGTGEGAFMFDGQVVDGNFPWPSSITDRFDVTVKTEGGVTTVTFEPAAGSAGITNADLALLNGKLGVAVADTNQSNDDLETFSWQYTVQDTQSGDAKDFNSNPDIVIDAVARQPVVDALAITYPDGQEAAQPGDLITLGTAVTFVNLEAETPYVLVQYRPGWEIGGVTLTINGQEFSFTGEQVRDMALFYPSGNASGGSYFQIPLDPALWESMPSFGAGSSLDALKAYLNGLSDGDTLTVNVSSQVKVPATGFDADETQAINIGGATYDSFAPGDGEPILSNNVASSVTTGTEIGIGVVETEGIKAEDALANEDSSASVSIGIVPASGDTNDAITRLELTTDPAAVGGVFTYNGTALNYDGGKWILDAGVYDPQGTGAAFDTALLRFTPNADWSGTFGVSVSGVVSDKASNAFKDNLETGFTVTITPDADIPNTIVGTDPADVVGAGAPVEFSVSAFFQDTDGSEQHYVLVEKKDGWEAAPGTNYELVTDDSAVPPVTYFKVPVDSYGGADGKTGSATVHLVTSPDIASDGAESLKIGAMAEEMVNGAVVDSEAVYDAGSVSVTVGVVESQAGDVLVDPTGTKEEVVDYTDGSKLHFSLDADAAAGNNETLQAMVISDLKGGTLYDAAGTPLVAEVTGDYAGKYVLDPGTDYYYVAPNAQYTVDLEFTAMVRDEGSQVISGVPKTVTIDVEPVSSTPSGAEGTETSVAPADVAHITVTGTFTDLTGTEEHFVLIQQLPGWTPAPGTNYETYYDYSLDPQHPTMFYKIPVDSTASPASATFELIPPAGTPATDTAYTFKVGAFAQEVAIPDPSGPQHSLTFSEKVTFDEVTVTVGVVDAATTVTVGTPEAVDENAWVPLDISFNPAEGSNDELVSVTFANLGNGTLVNAQGVSLGSTVTAAQLAAGVYYKPGAYEDGTFNLTYTANVKDSMSNHTDTRTGIINVTVNPVTDVPAAATGTAADPMEVVAGQEAGRIAMDFELKADFAPDAGEEHFFYVSLPDGAVVPDGFTLVEHVPDGCLLTGTVYRVDADASGEAHFNLVLPEGHDGSSIHYQAGAYEAGADTPYEFSELGSIDTPMTGHTDGSPIDFSNLSDDLLIYGGGGDDVIRGGSGNDVIHGGSGDDTIYGGAGDDVIHGDSGNNHLYGGAGDDIIIGGSGNDIIYGGAGNDTLTGGGGNDTFVWTMDDMPDFKEVFTDTITDFTVGNDTLDLTALGLSGSDIRASVDGGDLTMSFSINGAEQHIVLQDAVADIQAYTNTSDVQAMIDAMITQSIIKGVGGEG